ncbi:MAG: carboxypeptidase regulatory-like domain-containing protein [bacterium]|nr:carboxypeptidase regulatory-like domain-containing protein [bacterium]
MSVTTLYTETEVTGTATDPDGTYTLTGLPAGTYRLEFTAPGFQDAELTDQTVEAGQIVEGTDIALLPDAE